MLKKAKHVAVLTCLCWVSVCGPTPANAATDGKYPDAPIHFVVGFSPGGGTDTVARLLARKVTEQTGQSIVVDNRPGAGGAIASEYVNQAHPDGYTVLFISSSFTISPNFQKLPFDPVKDFAPISLASTAPLLLVANPAVPVHTVKDLIDYAHAHPGKLNYASAGIGSALDMAGVMFTHMAKTDITDVPYKGADAMTDLMSGRVQLSFAGIPQTLPLVKAGKLKAIAVTAGSRARAMPEVPTIAESGLPGYDMTEWYGVVGPAKMPARRVAILSAEIRRALADPEVQRQMLQQGLEAHGDTPEAFSAFIAEEVKKWSDLVKTAHINTGAN